MLRIFVHCVTCLTVNETSINGRFYVLLVGWLVGCLPGNNVLKTGTIFRFMWNGAR